MKKISYLLATLSLCVVATSCDKSSDLLDEPFTPQLYHVKGKVEKGPFISGSEISLQPMDAQLQVLGSMFNTSITDNTGSFSLGQQEFTTPYAEFMANGYFFNEVKGTLSNGTLTLRALVDLRDNTTINVNVLTHLKYARIKNLVASGKKFNEANKQAQKELLNAFGLGKYNQKEVSSFSITAGTDESAALIAISSLLLLDRTEAEFTEYLSRLSADFGNNGKFSEEIENQINSDKQELSEYLEDINTNIINRYSDLGMQVQVKDLSYFIDWNNDGTAGNEILKEGDKISIDITNIEVPNEGGEYTVSITSPIEVYLEPQGNNEIEQVPSTSVPSDNFITDLYELDDSYYLDNEISYTTKLNNNKLTITISALLSADDKYSTIYLYDYTGGVVGTIQITQKGKPIDIPISDIPLLGKDGQSAVAAIAMNIAGGLADYNLIEQYYNYNKTTNLVNAKVSPNSNTISDAWSKLYKANTMLLQLKQADESRLNAYGNYINVLSALCYSNLIYGWGNIPYFEDYNQIQDEINSGMATRESTEVLFHRLEDKLHEAIETLPEKKNESVTDINGFFFASKDVARVLLANIYMYQGMHNEARHLLEEVINSGFYKLDASTGFKTSNSDTTLDYTDGSEPASGNNDINIKESTEVIFALFNGNNAGTRSDIVIETTKVLPYITLSDVLLSYVECCYMVGDLARAEPYIQNIIDTKKLNVTESNLLLQIKQIREQISLNSGTYFAFLKRTGLAKEICGIEEYQLLLPIPQNELDSNPGINQNDGY